MRYLYTIQDGPASGQGQEEDSWICQEISGRLGNRPDKHVFTPAHADALHTSYNTLENKRSLQEIVGHMYVDCTKTVQWSTFIFSLQ